MRIIPTVAALLLGAATAHATPQAMNERKALVGGVVVHVDGGDPLPDAVVVIAGDRIREIGPRASTDIPAGAEVIDLTGMWLVPGLFNLHTHFGLVLPGKMAVELANESDAELALRMASNARKSLLAGVTSVRTPGDKRRADIALKKSIAKGESVGPRIESAGEMVDITGGHGASGETYDGPYELRKAVRNEIRHGASWIKIAISGGIATQGGAIAEALMTPDEIEAVIDAAHRLGAKVTAHSGSPEATNIAVDYGIDCIEHGYFLTRDVFEKMKANGTWYVPTIVVSQPATHPFFERIGSPPWYLDRLETVGADHWKALETAVDVGVRIALGTDQFPYEPNDGTTATMRELEYYVAAGMTPMRAIQAATLEPARLLGVDEELGSLESGKLADIIAVAGDPLENIRAFRELRWVMKGGVVYRDDLER